MSTTSHSPAAANASGKTIAHQPPHYSPLGFGRIRALAGNTFLEAVRQKLFHTLVILAIALIGSANFFRQFDFGSSELKFISDFGLGAILFFGSILAIVVTAQLFFSEVENRTALTILAKPLRRWEFILGKFLGIMGVLLVFIVIMVVLLGLMLYWRESSLMARYPEAFADGRIVHYGGLFLYGVIELIKLGILAALALLVASFSNTNLYTVIVSFFLLLICQLQYIARDYWTSLEQPVVRWLVYAVSLICPNFQMFNVGELLIFGPQTVDMGGLVTTTALGTGDVVSLAIYGVLYIFFFLALAVFSFRSREI